MVDKRKGMSVAKLDLEIIVDREMTTNQRNIYLADIKIEWGRDGEYAKDTTVYCNVQHDFTIEILLRKHGLTRKRIKKIEITKVKHVGESVATLRPIIKWKITKTK
jgi:hypothetical protein